MPVDRGGPVSGAGMLLRGRPLTVAGWGRLSPPGQMLGVVHLRRAYVIDVADAGLIAVDARTGWGGLLRPPIRIGEPSA